MAAVSTQGWDLVFALQLPEVNRGIAAALRKDPSVIPRIAWRADDGSWSMEGEFDAWQLTGAGARNTGGTQVGMRFPIKRATLRGDGETHSIGKVTAVGLVRLGKLVEDSQDKLTIDHAGGVQGLRIEGDVPAGARDVLPAALEEFLNQNLQTFRHAFATVRLAGEGEGGERWFVPKKVAYVYADGKDDRSGYLGVLCLTDRYVEGNSMPRPQLDPALLSGGTACALVVSRSLFTEKLLLPGVARAFFKNSPPAHFDEIVKRYFVCEDDGRKVSMRKGTKPFLLSKAEVDLSFLYASLSLNWIFPAGGQIATFFALVEFVTGMIKRGKPAIIAPMDIYAVALSITVKGDEFVFDVSVRCKLKTETVFANIDVATITFQVTNYFRLVRTKPGEFGFKKSREPFHTTPSIDTPEWIKHTNELTRAVAIVVGIVVSVVTEGIAVAVIGVGIAAMEAGKDIAGMVIANTANKKAGDVAPVDLGKFVEVSLHPIQWAGTRAFKPAEINFDGDLLLTGEMQGA
jgi:hypothetical protein